MRRIISFIAAIASFGVTPCPVFGAEANATSPLVPPTAYPTSSEEVLLGNPINLTIVKEAPSGQLPQITGTLAISEAVSTGIKNNFSLKESEQSWIISKYLARSALGKFGPSASFNTFFGSSSIDQMLFFPGDTTVASPPMQPITRGTAFHAIFAGTQPLFTGGRLIGGYRAARAQEKQSLSAYKEERIATALRVKEAYWNTAWSEAKLRVAADYVKLREWSSNNMKMRINEGKLPRAEYLREEAELARARVLLNESYRDFNSALLNLKVAMAINISSLFTLKDALESSETAGDINTYLLDAARHRPEIARAESKVQELRAKRLVAISRYSPQVNLYGLGSNTTGKAPGTDESVTGHWGGVVGIVGGVTLFDSGSRLNELRAATATMRQASIEKQNTELKVAQEVSQAWIDLDLARRNVDLAKSQIISAEEDYRLFQARFQVGKSVALEAFDAAVKMYQARLKLLEAFYKCRLAQARLSWASGSI